MEEENRSTTYRLICVKEPFLVVVLESQLERVGHRCLLRAVRKALDKVGKVDDLNGADGILCEDACE